MKTAKLPYRRLSLALLVAFAAFALGALAFQGGSAPLYASQEPGMSNPYAIADIAEQVTPAVVYIQVEWPAQPQQRGNNPFYDPFFSDFFFFPFWPDQRPGAQPPQTTRGTGFIISEDGYVLTNQHVVGDPGEGQTIKVKISAPDFQGEVSAELLGSDYDLDLAVLKIEKPEGLDKLPTIPLGDSDASRPGEWVIAIGNPYGESFEHTVTVGVLSAKGREISIYDNETRSWKPYRNLMQTDAAINPGNSGGPLINIRGEAIGINTAVNAQAQGIGFAIPINTALRVKDQLITDGKVSRGFLGVNIEDVTAQAAGLAGLASPTGALVTRVEPGTPAESAGIQPFDIILKVDQTTIRSASHLTDVIGEYQPGEKVVLELWRQAQAITVEATLGTRPDAE